MSRLSCRLCKASYEQGLHYFQWQLQTLIAVEFRFHSETNACCTVSLVYRDGGLLRSLNFIREVLHLKISLRFMTFQQNYLRCRRINIAAHLYSMKLTKISNCVHSFLFRCNLHSTPFLQHPLDSRGYQYYFDKAITK